jgi:hypothetical protein
VKLDAAPTVTPRLLDREQAAAYLASSVDTVDRAIQAGQLPIVRLPVARSRKSGRGVPGVGRRILIDVQDLDRLIVGAKERRA